jgi:hypothetical protein
LPDDFDDWLEGLLGDDEGGGGDPFDEPAQPSGTPSGADLAGRLGAINSTNWGALNDWDLWRQVEDFQHGLGGRDLTPADLATLAALEGRLGLARNQQDSQVRQNASDFGDRARAATVARLGREGYRTPEQLEADQRAAHAAVDRLSQYENNVLNHLDDLPPGQRDAAIAILGRTHSRMAELAAQGHMPDADTIDIIRRITGSVWNTTQGTAMREGAEAAMDTANARFGEDMTKAVQAGLTGGVAGGAILMGVGVAPLAGMTQAQLGASMWGFGITTGAAEGYGSGTTYGGRGYAGVPGMVLGAARNAMPINLIGQVVEELRAPPGTTSGLGSAGRIVLSTIQDIGNVAGFGDALDAGSALVKGTKAASGTVGDLAEAARGLGGPSAGPRPSANQVDDAFRTAQARGQQLGDDFASLSDNLRRAEQAGDDAAAAAARRSLTDKAVEICDDFNGKNTLKNSGSGIQKDYANAMEPVFQASTERMVDNLNDAGYRMGGRKLTVDDFMDLRNPSSRGSVPMDRDLALNQMRARGLQDELEAIPTRGATAIDDFNRQYLTDKLNQVQQQTQLSLNGKPVPAYRANEGFQNAYNSAYRDVTREMTGTAHDARTALQEVTQAQHGEAYRDLNAIRGNLAEHPLNPAWSEQTGSVTPYKGYENLHHPGMGVDDATREANSMLETARGVVKDIDTKVEPAMRASGASPAALERVQEVKAFLNEVKVGTYPPSVASQMANDRFGTSITGLAEQMGSNLAAAAGHPSIALPPQGAPSMMNAVESGVRLTGTAGVSNVPGPVGTVAEAYQEGDR